MFRKERTSAACSAPAMMTASAAVLFAATLAQAAAVTPQQSVVSDFASMHRQEARVNTFTSSEQSNAAIAVGEDGGFVVVWDSRRQQSGAYGVYMQRYDATGSRIGGETQVNVFTEGMQQNPAVAIDGKGGAWVAWESFGQDGSMNAIIARRFGPDFDASTDEILVNQFALGQQSQVVIATDTEGNATLVWTSPTADAKHSQVVARRFDAAGMPLGDEFAIAPHAAIAGRSQTLPAVASTDQGRHAVVWAETDQTNKPAGIFGIRLSGSGDAQGDVLAISPADGLYHIEPSIACLKDGAFAVAWLTALGSDYVVSARTFDAAGMPTSAVQLISEPDARYASGVAIASSHKGAPGFFAAWNQAGDGVKDKDVVGRFLCADASPAGPIGRLNGYRKGVQKMTIASGKSRLVARPDGSWIAAWSGRQQGQDRSAVNVTLLSAAPTVCKLESAPAMSGASIAETLVAKPHVPPRYNAKTIPNLPNGGDLNPVAAGADFGFIGIINSGWTPPDPHLAAGPNQLVTMTNGAIAFFDKDGTKTFEDEIENSFGFWGSVGATNFVFDPEVLYDPHSGRFFAMACERAGSVSHFLLAVSDDSDPNGNWFKYRFNVNALFDFNIDSPNMGIDAQAVYLTADFFGPDEFGIYILDKADLLVGAAPATTSIDIIGSQSYGVPVTYDADAVAQYMIQAIEVGNPTTVILHAITDPLGTPTRVTTNLTVPAYNTPEDPPIMGTGNRPELFEARFWSCVYRNGSLWAVHHQNSTRVRARWYEIAMNDWPVVGTPELVQWGEIDLGGDIRTFFPSIWVDDNGNAAITTARSSPNEFISMGRALRSAGDPLGTFGPYEIVKESPSTYFSPRWGDYSGTQDDPAEPGVFWGTHEYSPGVNTWNTWIAKYQLGAAPTTVEADAFNVVRGQQVGGNLASLAESDDSRLNINAGFTAQPNEPPVWVELDGVSPTDNPSALSFTLEARAQTGVIVQRISLFNYDTQQFELVDSRNATSQDSVVMFDADGDITRFTEPGTGNMRARLTWRANGIVAVFPWQAGIDQAVWTVTP